MSESRMANRFRISTAIPRKLESLGLSPSAVLQQAGLPVTLFNQDKVQVTTTELFAFYRAIAELSQDPAIGLRLASEDTLERYDPVAIAALCTRSLRDALTRLSRYKQLTCPEQITLTESEGEGTVRFTWLLASEIEPEVLVDLCFAWILSIARLGLGKTVRPRRIEFARAGGHAALYEEHFGCPIHFNAPHNALVFDQQIMDAAFVTYNAELLSLVAPQLEAELRQQLKEKTLREQVKGVLKRMIAGQRPVIRDVAREMRMSTRTLQRRLTEEGVTFQQLLEASRRELARHYLLHSSLELNETAYLLGYEDANSFFRAFHVWEGTTPNQWRAMQLRENASSSVGVS